MGYVSQIAIAVDAAHDERFLRVLSRVGVSRSDVSQNGVGDVLLMGSYKWYDGYPDVDAVTEFLKSLPSDSYRFLRVGEEQGDIEDDGSFYDFGLGVVTRIESGEEVRDAIWPTDVELKEACDVEDQ